MKSNKVHAQDQRLGADSEPQHGRWDAYAYYAESLEFGRRGEVPNVSGSGGFELRSERRAQSEWAGDKGYMPRHSHEG